MCEVLTIMLWWSSYCNILMYEINMLCTLNFLNTICQLHFNKSGKEDNSFFFLNGLQPYENQKGRESLFLGNQRKASGKDMWPSPNPELLKCTLTHWTLGLKISFSLHLSVDMWALRVGILFLSVPLAYPGSRAHSHGTGTFLPEP